MNSFTYVPLLASLLVAGVCRLGCGRLWPKAAVWTLTVAAVASAVSAVGALVVLASPLPARVPWIATLGRWRPHAIEAGSPVPLAVSVLAAVALVLVALRAVREVRSLGVEAWQASRLAATVGRTRSEVVIVDDDVPHAHAVGLGITGRGNVIVSSSMLALLDPDEQAAMIAHERAHLRERHAMHLAVVRVATALNPLLVGLEGDLRLALERSADEAAAAVAGRPVAAAAIARAALGAIEHLRTPIPGLALHAHRVTDRVQALLDEPRERRRPPWALVAILVAAALALAWATHDTELFFEAARRSSQR